jgi:serine/threonine protein kinase
MGRGSGGKVNNALKETSSTTNTEGMNTYKSERTFPSFLRSQAKSPSKPKTKDALSKEHFKIIRRLGEGKFGSVFLAREIWTGMIVGLKVIEKKRIIRDNFLVQFIRELKIQSFLDHPNIIKVYGYFADEDHFYIILELGCDGQLFDVISGGQTLSEETTSFIIGNLLDAVDLMHKNKILHRDIKP